MADTKISALTAVTTAVSTHEFPVNEAGTSKKATIGQLSTYLGTVGQPRVFTMSGDHAISTIAATQCAFTAATTLEAGTYTYKYSVIMQSATLTVGVFFGVNFTGTAATHTICLSYPSTGTTASSGTADDVGATSGQLYEAMAHTSFSSTTPNLGFTGGVATINTNIPAFIEGILVVTVQGDLQLFHGSETATSTTVKAGTCLVVTRCA